MRTFKSTKSKDGVMRISVPITCRLSLEDIAFIVAYSGKCCYNAVGEKGA